MINLLRRRARLLWTTLALTLLAGCAVNPVTGRRQLVLISESQEIQIGQENAEQVVRALGLVDSDTLQAYVQRLGAALAARSERPELPWTFRVVEDPTPNAFALPGGYIFITRGLMTLLDTEAELASVLGHEIGHVTARHAVTQLSRAQLAQIGLTLGQVFVPELQPLGGALGAGLNLLFLKYGRDAERQSDELGFRYASELGYDLREMADVFEALARVGEREGQSPLPSWQATHPAPAERIEAVRAMLAAQPAEAGTRQMGRAPYLRLIDGMVYGENPRNGFFQQGVFLHPDLRFRVSFPQGWRTQNLPQAVVAASPQQDAVAQLTLAGATAEQAARAFFSQQGIQPLQTSRETINGLPAVAGYFRAQTQQGVIEGVATWVEYAGRTFHLVGYAPAGRFGAYDPLFRRVVGSFAPLTDPDALNVQPARIAIVRLPASVTLAEFNRQHPSVVPIQELALINQVEGPSSLLAAGTLVKRVVRG